MASCIDKIPSPGAGAGKKLYYTINAWMGKEKKKGIGKNLAPTQ
jgi:hypothetical protein